MVARYNAKFLFLFLFVLQFARLPLFSQDKSLVLTEKREEGKILIFAQNTGDQKLEVQYDITFEGLKKTKETPFTFQIAGKEEMMILELETIPGKSWSYNHRIGYRPVKEEIVVNSAPEVDKNIAKVEAINKRNQAVVKKAIPQETENKIKLEKGEDLTSPTKVESLVLYGKENCGRCQYLKKSLQNKNIPYKELDIVLDEKSGMQMWELLRGAGYEDSTITTPVVVLNGKLYYNMTDLVAFNEYLIK